MEVYPELAANGGAVGETGNMPEPNMGQPRKREYERMCGNTQRVMTGLAQDSVAQHGEHHAVVAGMMHRRGGSTRSNGRSSGPRAGVERPAIHLAIIVVLINMRVSANEW